MTAPRFDELIHASTRLWLVATLAAVDWAEFSYLRDRVGLSDSALSKQLEDAGYLETERRLQGHRHKLRARLTTVGREAFDGHVAALEAIAATGRRDPSASRTRGVL